MFEQSPGCRHQATADDGCPARKFFEELWRHPWILFSDCKARPTQGDVPFSVNSQWQWKRAQVRYNVFTSQRYLDECGTFPTVRVQPVLPLPALLEAPSTPVIERISLQGNKRDHVLRPERRQLRHLPCACQIVGFARQRQWANERSTSVSCVTACPSPCATGRCLIPPRHKS